MTIEDLQSIVELTASQHKEIFPIVPQVIMKDTRRGHALWKSGRISIPKWAWQYGEAYLMYYTIHELTHYVNGKLGGHGPFFKQMEDVLLKVWDISIKRAKCYPKAVYHKGKEVPSPKNKKLLTAAQ